MTRSSHGFARQAIAIARVLVVASLSVFGIMVVAAPPQPAPPPTGAMPPRI